MLVVSIPPFDLGIVESDLLMTASAVFPGLMEAIDQKDEERFKKWVDITENAILTAAESL